jgi:CTP synthase
MENQWFIEAARELERYKGRDNVVFVHLGLVPVLDDNGQQKTKPLQQSITQLRSCGIFPDFVVGRSTEKLTKAAKEKIEWLCNLTEGHVISDPSLKTVYALPIIFEAEGLAKSLPERLQLQPTKTLNVWKDLLAKIDKPSSKVKVAICGKYTELADSYISVSESLIHAGAHHDVGIEVVWIETTQFESDPKQVEIILSKVQGLIVPGGFGSRGTEGKIMAIKYAREHKLPYLGLCFGLQLAVIEFARHVCNMPNANSTEINPNTKFPVVDIMEHQKAVTQKGGSMRLGNYDAKLLGDSKVSQLYKQLTGDGAIAHERHRHRYEVNPAYHQQLVTGGIQFSGTSADGKLVEFIELKDHPFFMATQAHPELKSRLDHPAPLFYGFVQAIKELSKHKNINNSQ